MGVRLKSLRLICFCIVVYAHTIAGQRQRVASLCQTAIWRFMAHRFQTGCPLGLMDTDGK